MPVGARLGLGRVESNIAHGGRDLLQRQARIADNADGAMFLRIVAMEVDRNELAVRVGEDRPRSCGATRLGIDFSEEP
jgi:hypothetical protein